MSRFAKRPIAVPAGAEVAVAEGNVSVTGPLGKLTLGVVDPSIAIERTDGGVRLSPAGAVDKRTRTLLGTYCRLVRNMIVGVTEGFTRELELVGVGYRANADDEGITLSLGYSNQVRRQFPEGVRAETPSQTEVVVRGIDKQAVGQFADEIRKLRPTEPYKGKGVRFKGARVVLKETKKK